MLKYILLGFLNYGPMTGYELKTVMDESTMHFWHAYHSQIYTVLRKLEAEGLVNSEQEDGDDKLNRRVYTITEPGRAELEHWLHSSLTEPSPVKEALLVRLFFSGDRDKQSVIDELRFQRQLHQQKLEHYRELERSPLPGVTADNAQRLGQHLPFWGATLRFGIEYETSYLRWLDETIHTIEDLSTTP
jgi:PadR family transcriptional regulator, regulatory protein AphA